MLRNLKVRPQGRRVRWLLAAACILVGGASSLRAETWTMSHLEQIPLLQHELAGRMPILNWHLPDSLESEFAHTENPLTLKSNIEVAWARGFVPAAKRFQGHPEGCHVTAATLQEMNLPIHLLTAPPLWRDNYSIVDGKVRHWEYDFWPLNSGLWFDYINLTQPERRFPVFAKATPTAGYTEFLAELQKLKNGATYSTTPRPPIDNFDGVWMDYEGDPGPYDPSNSSNPQGLGEVNGVNVKDFYENGEQTFPNPGVALTAQYPGLFDGLNTYTPSADWEKYAYALRRWLLDESMRKALTQVYSLDVPIGNYGDFFDADHLPIAGTVAMPVLYGNNTHLKNHLGDTNEPPVNQHNAEVVYRNVMIRQLSKSAEYAGTTGQIVPWVSQLVDDQNKVTTYDYFMPEQHYRELLRHYWLRGVEGMYVFNPHNPQVSNGYQSVAQATNEIKNATAILDEMLCFRGYLDHGTVMNTAYSTNTYEEGAIWSGLKWDGQAIVRAVNTFGTQNANIDVDLDVSTTITIAAPPTGATYLLGPGATQQRIDPLPPSAYFQFDNNYNDSSGTNYAFAESGSLSNPTFSSTDKCGPATLQARYALRADADNGYGVLLSRDPNTPTNGNRILLDNSSGVYSSASWTTELFVKIPSGTQQDPASIVARGSSDGSSKDWTLLFRDGTPGSATGTGVLELAMFDDQDSSASAWIRTADAPLTKDVWHHIAIVFDGPNKQATLYVDHVKQNWSTNHSPNITTDGKLSFNLKTSGTYVILGRYSRGLNATMDDFRFTPAVLDPAQMLRPGAQTLATVVNKTGTATDPSTTSDVPGRYIPRLLYGTHANIGDQTSTMFTRVSDMVGNGLKIPNANNVFNASSFTAEGFIKVHEGNGNYINLITKGLNANNRDWVLASNGGKLELSMFKDATTWEWIRTSQACITPNTWHHIALTYDAKMRQATVYVDHVKQNWAASPAHSSGFSDTGELVGWDFRYLNSSDYIGLGYFRTALNATYNVFRYTPEVLSTHDMLRVAPQD